MSQRHRGILLSLLIVSIFLVSLAFVPQAGAIIFYSEDFDSTSVGGLPTGWTNISIGGEMFDVQDDFSYSSPNSIRAYTDTLWEITPDNHAGRGYYDFGSSRTDIDVTFRWRVDSDDSGNICEGSDPTCHVIRAGVRRTLNAADIIAEVALLGGDMIRYRDGTAGWNTATGVTITYGQWYLIRFVLDFTSMTYAIYIDGELIDGDAEIDSAQTSVRYFHMDILQSEPGYQLPISEWVDDLSIDDDLEITSTPVTAGTIDTAYSYDADSDAGVAEETWSLPTNPGFLSIDSETGEITGTPTEGGYLNVIVQVDAGGDTATQDYNITVDGTIAIISTAVTMLGRYQQYIYAADSNYATNETWELTTNPSWLSISVTTGLLTASPPTTPGTYDVVISVDTDITGDDGPATQSYAIQVGSASGGGLGDWPSGGGGLGGGFGFGLGGDNAGEEDTFEPPGCETGTYTVLFESRYSKDQINLYMWNFGDGSSTKWTPNQQIQHTFAGDGMYTVTHVVQFNDGTIGRETHQVEVGFCKPPEFSVIAWTGYVAALAAVMWLAFVFSRKKRIMQAALVLTIIAAGLGTYAIGF